VPKFLSQNIEIAFQDYNETSVANRPAIILVHGFASNSKINWVDTFWVEFLQKAGYRVITLDNRGHGLSQKLYDSSFYPARVMAQDVINLIDYLNLEDVSLLGFSMGARISAYVCLDAPERVRTVIFGGMGINLIKGMSNSESIIDGLMAEKLSDVRDKAARQFRIFAEHTKSDLKALAACLASSRAPISVQDVKNINIPALVAVGDQDTVGGSAEELAALLPQGHALVLEGKDHMRSTGTMAFKRGALEFLEQYDKKFIKI